MMGTLPRTGSVAVEVDATPEQVWAVLADITRAGKWSRICEVQTAVAPEVISWRTVPSRLYPDSTRWTYELTPIEGGCRVTQSFEVLKLNPIVDRLFYALIPAHRDRSAALAADVHSLGAVARSKSTVP
jgi:hypothetical protein